MEKQLSGRRILLGVTGGISAYKAAELIRLLRKSGADVQVVMTEAAKKFVTPLTLGTLSEREVLSEVFPENARGSWTKHVSLGRWADLFVIAPASAQTIAKIAAGFCDSMLTAAVLAARCPVLVCPAMDHDMYLHPATQNNLKVLGTFGYDLMDPGYGELASGLIGTGRLPEPEEIYGRISSILEYKFEEDAVNLKGKTVLVTAGPTREPVDPVRFVSNGSTGMMGFSIAARAVERGAEVILISGPSFLPTPRGVQRIDVGTAQEMYETTLQYRDASIIIMSAAVSDYAPVSVSRQKLKKTEENLTIEMRRTPDILSELGASRTSDQVLVGFALESENGLENARRKLREKNLDWIVLNLVNEAGSGFGTGTNRVILVPRDGEETALPVLEKRVLAGRLLDKICSG